METIFCLDQPTNLKTLIPNILESEELALKQQMNAMEDRNYEELLC